MSDIVEKIKQLPDLKAGRGCSFKQLREAQEELDAVLPDEYIDYVRTFGHISFAASEWTGLNISGRLNTVNATKKEKSVNPDFPRGFFVLEDLGIDAKLIIVNEQGEVYLLQYEKKKYLCKTIAEYLDICTAENR